MIPFRVMPGAALICRIDFSGHATANLAFRDAGGQRFPLHVSLRSTEGQIVLNRKDAKGWRREIRLPHDFAGPDGAEGAWAGALALRFFRGGATLSLDGQPLLRIDPFPRPDRQGRFGLRRGFPALSEIVGVTPQGGVLSSGFEIRPAALPPGNGALPWRLRGRGAARQEVIGLSPRFEVFCRGPEPLVLPDGSLLQPLPLSAGGFGAVLPGRIWRGQPAEEGLQIAGFGISRARLCALLASGLRRPAANGDDFLALQLIEHCHYSNSLSALSPPQQLQIRALAEGLGLSGFFGPAPRSPGPPGAAPAGPAPALRSASDPAPRTGWVALALSGPDRSGPPSGSPGGESPVAALEARLAGALRASLGRSQPAAPDPLLRAAVAGLEPLAPRHPDLLRRLTEGFCLAGQADLLDPAARAAGLTTADSAGSAWEVSTDFPWQIAAGLSTPAILARLRQLSHPRSGWFATPAIATGMARALARPGLTPDSRAALLQGWMTFHESLSAEYFSRHGCAALLRFSAGLLRGFAGLTPALQQALTAHWLRCCSLSPGFWAALRALSSDKPASGSAEPAPAPLVWPEELQRAERAFHTLCQPQSSAADLAAALDLFDLWGNPATARFRRGLLGPSGAFRAEGAALQLADLQRSLIPPGEALLRHLIAPLTPEDPAPEPDLRALAAGAVARIWTGVSPRPAVAENAPLPQGGPQGPDKGALSGNYGFLAREYAADTDAAQNLLQEPHRATLSAAGADLLVVVMTCQARLESHLSGLRAGWLQQLSAAGIPWIAVIGGGAPGAAPRLHDQVLTLSCPDDYEGLPRKTLALLAWFRDHSPCARLLKVDDDVFVHVAELARNLPPPGSDYVGRALSRGRGETDRRWHQRQAQSPGGRYDLDKSPEPSVYADGGSGYLLSRRAVCAALEQAERPAGRWLVACSFLEDKLVGDLLQRAGIALQPAGYYMGREERVGYSELIRPAWGQAPRPFTGSGILGVHLDHPDLQPETLQAARRDLPRKDRIWPSYLPARFGWASNGLTLLSPRSRLARAAGAEVAVVAVIRNEAAMLPAFLAHYRALGVTGFLIADNGSDDGSTEYLADQPDVALFAADTPYALSHYGVAWQEALLSSFRAGRWTVVADADELLVWSPSARGDLAALLRGADFKEADAVRVFMLDMYPQGPLAAVDFRTAPPFEQAAFSDRRPFLALSASRGPFSDADTWTSGLRHRLLPGSRPELFVAQKMALLRWHPRMQLSEGLHYAAGITPAARSLVFGHFKYTAWFHAKVLREAARGAHFNGAEEYRRYLELPGSPTRGLFHETLSGHWTESAFIRHLFAGYRPPGGC